MKHPPRHCICLSSDPFINSRKVSFGFSIQRLVFIFGLCFAISACKLDETRIRGYIPIHLSKATVMTSEVVPFVCASAVFLTSFDQDEVASLPGVMAGPIFESIPDNSVIYRVIRNADRSCGIAKNVEFGGIIISEYLYAPNIFFSVPEAGKLIIFDPARGMVLYLEG